MEVGDEQLTLRGVPGRRRRRPRGPVPVAEECPVARVVVDRGAAHLDRVFEYLVPAAVDADARPGVRVRVRFGGQDAEGFLLDRVEEAEHEGALVPLRTVVSPEVVLTPAVLTLARGVARRYAGTLPDVLRLAVPPRHARTEGEVWPDPGAAQPTGPGTASGPLTAPGPLPEPAPGTAAGASVPDAPAWLPYEGGAAFLRHVTGGGAPQAVWTALPGPAGDDWADALAQAVRAARAGGRGSVVVVPTRREVDQVTAALEAAGVTAWTPGSTSGWVRLVADDGPTARYRAFLATVRGAADVVVGTRAAAFAPVRRLGLAVCWDEGDPLHAEQRAPYPHVREVLLLRSQEEGCAVLLGGWTRSVAAHRLVLAGTAHPVQAPRATVRARVPRIEALTAVDRAADGAVGAARLPGRAWRVLQDALRRGPVLLQVPRAGYVPSLACARCRTAARCPECHGPLGLRRADDAPQCRWCGRLAVAWRCPECSADRLRSVRVGSERTAEELRRAFPGVVVRTSGATAAGGVLDTVPEGPSLVVATPGAEPRAPGGYAAALLLDATLLTQRADLDVAEQALRTWTAAAALVRPAPEGVVVVVGDPAPAPLQALVRWDPAGFADRELAERAELDLPPAVHVVSLTGARTDVAALLTRVDLPAGSAVLGPVPLGAWDRESPSVPRHDRPGGDRPSRPGGRPPAPDGTASSAARPAPPRARVAEPVVQGTLPVDVGAEAPAGSTARGVTDRSVDDDAPVRALVRSPWSSGAVVTARVAAAAASLGARRDHRGVRVQVEPTEIL